MQVVRKIVADGWLTTISCFVFGVSTSSMDWRKSLDEYILRLREMKCRVCVCGNKCVLGGGAHFVNSRDICFLKCSGAWSGLRWAVWTVITFTPGHSLPGWIVKAWLYLMFSLSCSRAPASFTLLFSLLFSEPADCHILSHPPLHATSASISVCLPLHQRPCFPELKC